MSVQQALKFIVDVRGESALLGLDEKGLVLLARARGFEVTWPEIQEAFRVDWLMRGARYGVLESPGATASLHQVKEYFEQTTPTILQDVGHSYQAGILPSGCYRESNLFFAARAGILNGERILDAGCGAGGPAVDLAEAFPSLQVEGITLSSVQARAARELAQTRGVDQRVSISQGDYHRCPFESDSFDRVIFLETAGYSESPEELWREVFRLLKPGGWVYLKEPFTTALPHPGSAARREMQAVLDIYRYRMRTMSQVCRELREAGFEQVAGESLKEQLTTRFFFVDAMNGTEFGRQHRTALDNLPAYYGDIVGRRPLA